MTGPVQKKMPFRLTLFAGAACIALGGFAAPAWSLSQLQPAPTAEELKKPAKPGQPGEGGGVDGGEDEGGGAQPKPPAGGQPNPPPAGGGGAEDGGDDGGGGAQPAPPAGELPKPPAGGQPNPPPAGGGGAEDGGDDGGGAQPAPPAGELPKPPAGGQPNPPPAGGGGEDGGEDEGGAQPAPPAGEQPAPPAPPGGGDEAGDPARPPVDEGGPLPEIVYDLETLPQPVKRMRELIVEACKTGDPEKLRPLIGAGESRTRLALDDAEADPVDILKQSSGDGEGQEIMAILLEVLEAGYVHLDAGKDTELYVWPYFFAVPLEKLTTPQRVELFKLITAGDYEDMKGYGAYIFYRVGITPDGKWDFFLAGD